MSYKDHPKTTMITPGTDMIRVRRCVHPPTITGKSRKNLDDSILDVFYMLHNGSLDIVRFSKSEKVLSPVFFGDIDEMYQQLLNVCSAFKCQLYRIQTVIRKRQNDFRTSIGENKGINNKKSSQPPTIKQPVIKRDTVPIEVPSIREMETDPASDFLIESVSSLAPTDGENYAMDSSITNDFSQNVEDFQGFTVKLLEPKIEPEDDCPPSTIIKEEPNSSDEKAVSNAKPPYKRVKVKITKHQGIQFHLNRSRILANIKFNLAHPPLNAPTVPSRTEPA